MKVCIVVSEFYPKVSKMLVSGALKYLNKKKINKVKLISVPGTYEIPVVISNLRDRYDGFIALGCVIQGETPHFKFLCNSVFNGLVKMSVDNKLAISNGILTCKNKNQALKRANPNKIDKGGSAAKALISVIKIIK